MKPAYYLSVLVIAGIAIGTITAIRSHARSKKIHRVLSYEEPAQKTDKSENTADTSENTDSDPDFTSADTDNFEISEQEVSQEKLPDSLKSLTASSLKESRSSQFAKRIRPRDYLFTSAKIDTYINSLAETPKAQAREKRRLKILESIKPTLVAFLSKNPYEGKIVLAGSKPAPKGATIAMANENVLIMRTSSGTTELKWSDVSATTIAAMLQNMARIRERADLAYRQSQTTHNIEVADDYLLAAVFCDWYGNYTGAVRLIKKAVAVNPELADFAKNIFTD